jgi:hypothetical protein
MLECIPRRDVHQGVKDCKVPESTEMRYMTQGLKIQGNVYTLR